MDDWQLIYLRDGCVGASGGSFKGKVMNLNGFCLTVRAKQHRLRRWKRKHRLIFLASWR